MKENLESGAVTIPEAESGTSPAGRVIELEQRDTDKEELAENLEEKLMPFVREPDIRTELVEKIKNKRAPSLLLYSLVYNEVFFDQFKELLGSALLEKSGRDPEIISMVIDGVINQLEETPEEPDQMAA